MTGVVVGIDLGVALKLAEIEVVADPEIDLRVLAYLLTRISAGLGAGASKA